MKVSRYTEYKRTAIAWLGDIPSHWTIKRLKWSVVGCMNGVWGEEPDGVNDVVCLRVADFNRENLTIAVDSLTVRAVEPQQFTPRQLVRGDLLIEKSGGGEKQLVGCVVQFNHDFEAVCSNFVARMPVSQGHSPRYWAYTHASLYIGKLNYLAIKQTTGIQNLDIAVYLNTLTAFPPIAEQKKIAAFLDWKASQIDALIAKKQALLAKLKEKRLAAITRAVTKGLDPNATVRESNVPWLGQVPKHWKIKRVKFIARVGNGSTPDRDDSAYWSDGTYPWLNSSVVNKEVVSSADQFVTPLALLECHLPKITPPAVLVGITGQGRTRGMASTLAFEATINQHLAFVKVDPAVGETAYVRRVFDAAYSYLRSESDGGGSTKGAITCAQIAEMPIPIPPKSEQIAIAKLIDAQLARIDKMSEKTSLAIARLNEYRAALINAATTGKINVQQTPIPGDLTSSHANNQPSTDTGS